MTSFYACAAGSPVDEQESLLGTAGAAGTAGKAQQISFAGTGGAPMLFLEEEGGSSTGRQGGGAVEGEICDDGFDNNANGAVDEGCACTLGATKACFPGLATQVGVGKACVNGTQTCIAFGEIVRSWGPCTGFTGPQAEACNQIDDDCDGQVDEDNVCKECNEGEQQPCDVNGCGGTRLCQGAKWGACAVQNIQVQVEIDGDCVTSSPACPACAPHPVGCNLDFGGGTKAGCVVLQGSTVYMKEGKICDKGRVTGTITCGVTSVALDAQNCPINKPPGSDVRYPDSPDGCPK